MKTEFRCASRWLTGIIGIFKPWESPFAKETPDKRDPIKPGPFVTAIASKLV